MSVPLMARIMTGVELPRPKLQVLLSMAENANDDGTSCRPSVDRIAWKAGYKPRAVEDIMRDLRADKILVQVAPATRHRPPEYEIHLENCPEKMPFEEWRAIYGKHARKARRREAAAAARGAASAPLKNAKNGDSGVQSHGLGVQSDVSRGAVADVPYPTTTPPDDTPKVVVERAHAREGKTRKGKGSRKASPPPDAPDYGEMVARFVADDPDGDEVAEFIARITAKNATGKMEERRQYKEFCVPVVEAREGGANPEAITYALEQANKHGAKSMGYFRAVLKNNPEGDPAKKKEAAHAGGGDPAANGYGGGGITKTKKSVKDGYEYLFDD